MENYDKYSCHEIEALVKSGKLDMNALSVDQLNAFLDYICENDLYEDECFYKCTDALRAKESTSYTDTAINLMNAAINQYDALCDSTTEHNEMKVVKERDERHPVRISKKRMAALLITAALTVSLLAMTAFAVFNPFSEFGITIRELFGFKTGDSIESESKDIIVGGDVKHYNSFEELCDEYNRNFHKIKNQFVAKKISSSNEEKFTEVTVNYDDFSLNKAKVICHIIFMFQEPPYDKNEYLSLSNSVCEIHNDYEFIVIKDEDFYQAILFEQECIYILTADSSEELNLALDAFDN